MKGGDGLGGGEGAVALAFNVGLAEQRAVTGGADAVGEAVFLLDGDEVVGGGVDVEEGDGEVLAG